MQKKTTVYYFTLILLIIFLLIILTPKISIKAFPFIKEQKFKKFNNYLMTVKNFDPQIFWQFREFYCPGYFELNKTGLKDINFKSFGFLKNERKIDLVFARYNCSYLKSIETLTKENHFSAFINENEIKNNYYLIKKTDEFIYLKEKKSNKYYLLFLVSDTKMKKAVGFFDYKEKDKNITNDKNWLNISLFSFNQEKNKLFFKN